MEVTVSFGPSRSPNFTKARYLAERDATHCTLYPDGEVIAIFELGLEDLEAFGNLARLIAFVEHWRSSDVSVAGEHEPPYLVSQMALCARDYGRRFGRCTYHDDPGIFLLPKCRVCPLRPSYATERPRHTITVAAEEAISDDGSVAVIFTSTKPPPSLPG
jgi:hypothetical protein